MRIRAVEDFGAIARQRRQDLNLSQAELATCAGVTRQWLVRFEQGNSEVSLSKVFAVLNKLELLVKAESAESIHPVGATTAASKKIFSVPRIEMPLLDMAALRASLEASGNAPSQTMIAGIKDAIQSMNATGLPARTTEVSND